MESELYKSTKTAYYHLPGLFEFYEFYKVFLPIFKGHREYFYDWCEIGSIYGAPSDCLWGGGRVENEGAEPEEVLGLLSEYKISARLTFSNSLIEEEHLKDKKCNRLCNLFNKESGTQNGVIIYSDLLLDYIKKTYPNLYFVSSTTKVITDYDMLLGEVDRDDFKYVVPDFRLNKEVEKFNKFSLDQKQKVEFLCNECCSHLCTARKACYEEVSRKNLGLNASNHRCVMPESNDGYKFSKAMANPMFIGIDKIISIYLPMGFSNFKIEGRGLGSAMLLEFILYYMTKPEYQIHVREMIYLDSMLDLF